MPSQKKSYRILNSDKRHAALAELAELAGFNSVPAYLQWLVDNDAKQRGFDLPDNQTQWGGNRHTPPKDV